MSTQLRMVALIVFIALALTLALGACGGAGEQKVTGQVLAVDATAKTFSLRGSDGQRYDFKAGSGVDLTHVKEHMDEKKQIEVRYTGTTSPYEASYAH